MVMNYLNKVGKYISSHRILFIICVLAAFIIIANIATYFSNYEYYGNCQSNQKKETFTSNNNNNNNSKNKNSNKNSFMVEQMKNMQNANAQKANA